VAPTTVAAGVTVAPGATTLPATVPTTLPPATPAPLPYAGVVAIGDSVMLGAKAALEQRMPGILVDAAVNRQVKGGAELATALVAQGRIGRAVIVHLGTNGVTTQQQFDELMTSLAGVPRVVMLNTKVPRPWEGRVNGLIADTVQKYPNVVFVDWKTQGGANKAWVWNDGIHLRPEGATAFADLIAQAVG
jgi:lysophospholipase L1-like esterase